MASPEVLKKIRALMARAVDPGATEEEQRTSAHVAAKLCREHGVSLGEVGAESDEPSVVTRQRVEYVINGVRTVVETVNAGRSGLDAALGFDVFGFVQAQLRDRAQSAITDALKKPAPRVRTRAERAKRKR